MSRRAYDIAQSQTWSRVGRLRHQRSLHISYSHISYSFLPLSCRLHLSTCSYAFIYLFVYFGPTTTSDSGSTDDPLWTLHMIQCFPGCLFVFANWCYRFTTYFICISGSVTLLGALCHRSLKLSGTVMRWANNYLPQKIRLFVQLYRGDSLLIQVLSTLLAFLQSSFLM